MRHRLAWCATGLLAAVLLVVGTGCSTPRERASEQPLQAAAAQSTPASPAEDGSGGQHMQALTDEDAKDLEEAERPAHREAHGRCRRIPVRPRACVRG